MKWVMYLSVCMCSSQCKIREIVDVCGEWSSEMHATDTISFSFKKLAEFHKINFCAFNTQTLPSLIREYDLNTGFKDLTYIA